MRTALTKIGFRGILACVLLLSMISILLLISSTAEAFPDHEVVWEAAGEPPFAINITSETSDVLLIDERQIAISAGEAITLFDIGTFALASVQPASTSVEDETDGILGGVAYSSYSDQLLASQEDGDLLIYEMQSLAETPRSEVIADGNKLGPLVVDPNTGEIYIADNTAHSVYIVEPLNFEVSATIPLIISGITSFSVTDALFLKETDEVYFTTDAGALFYTAAGSGVVTLIDIGINLGSQSAELSSLAALPDGSMLYIVDETNALVSKVDTSTHLKDAEEIDLVPNAQPSSIVITDVENPDGVYAYVAGASGVSVINTATDEVLDFGEDEEVDGEPMPTSAEPVWLVATDVTDGYIFPLYITGSLGLISENPFLLITDLTYADGASSLGQGGSFTVTVLANAAGTMEMRIGGGSDASGVLLTDNVGATTQDIALETETPVTFTYDDNVEAFEEGSNDLWIFVSTEEGLRGRRLTEVLVDTPPPLVVMRSTGFGANRIYVVFERLTATDIATYHVYVDTDPDAVLTKEEVALTVAQTESGDTITAEITDLENGQLYYIAMEAVDAGGNTSPQRTSTLTDGSRASAQPEKTGGPAAFSGEKGCSLAQLSSGGERVMAFLLLLPLFVIAGFRRKRVACLMIAMVALLSGGLFISTAYAEEQPAPSIEERQIPATKDYLTAYDRPPLFSIEAKTGFWMPQSENLKRFFDPCCNLVTRVEGSLLFQKRYGIELGVGFLYKSGSAVGESSGQLSDDHYKLILIPLELSFVWRADYFRWRYLVPYLKAGGDGWIFHEGGTGDNVKGIKWGMHGSGGLQINLSKFGGSEIEFRELGIEDLFLTLEAQYQWIDSFGSTGLDLSGPLYSIGFLFLF